jgi:hypothetical protein
MIFVGLMLAAILFAWAIAGVVSAVWGWWELRKARRGGIL